MENKFAVILNMANFSEKYNKMAEPNGKFRAGARQRRVYKK